MKRNGSCDVARQKDWGRRHEEAGDGVETEEKSSARVWKPGVSVPPIPVVDGGNPGIGVGGETGRVGRIPVKYAKVR